MIKFYSRSGYDNRKNYRTKEIKRKWFGFYGYYLAQGNISWTGNSYFVIVDITDLNWRDCKADNHWYQYKRHFKYVWEAKKWCVVMMGTPPNYIKETWGIRPIKRITG